RQGAGPGDREQSPTRLDRQRAPEAAAADRLRGRHPKFWNADRAGHGVSCPVRAATQPALLAKRKDGSEGFKGGFNGVREIAPEPERLYDRLRRVTVMTPVKLTDDELAEQL